MNDKAAVFIATTQGPVGIMRLTVEPRLRLSIASIGLETKKSSISDAYHDFVSLDTGVIARHTQTENYRLHLQRDIEQGDSWKLGIYVAHQLFDQQRLAELCIAREPLPLVAGPVILATGAVNIDDDVQAVGDIPQKLAMAEPLLQRAYELGIPVYFFLPQQNLTGDLKTTMGNFEERYANLQFVCLSRLTFEALPDILARSQSTDSKPNCRQATPTKLIGNREMSELHDALSAEKNPSSKRAAEFIGIIKTPRIYLTLLLIAALSPLAIISAMNQTNSSEQAESHTRIRLLTSANNRCFDALSEEAWKVLTWSQDNRIYGIERVCQMEIHTENMSPHDHHFEIYTRDQLLTSGVVSAASAGSLFVPVYQLKNTQLTLKLSDKNGLQANTTVTFQ
jgi:hypothetical protein